MFPFNRLPQLLHLRSLRCLLVYRLLIVLLPQCLQRGLFGYSFGLLALNRVLQRSDTTLVPL